jgi:hypothetical protein
VHGLKMTDYPLPSHAAYIWFAGDRLMLGLPPTAGHERGHSVSIPLSNESAFDVLLGILAERAREVRPIGTKSTPVQYDLDNVLRHMRKQRELERRQWREEATELLKGVGL